MDMLDKGALEPDKTGMDLMSNERRTTRETDFCWRNFSLSAHVLEVQYLFNNDRFKLTTRTLILTVWNAR